MSATGVGRVLLTGGPHCGVEFFPIQFFYTTQIALQIRIELNAFKHRNCTELTYIFRPLRLLPSSEHLTHSNNNMF